MATHGLSQAELDKIHAAISQLIDQTIQRNEESRKASAQRGRRGVVQPAGGPRASRPSPGGGAHAGRVQPGKRHDDLYAHEYPDQGLSVLGADCQHQAQRGAALADQVKSVDWLARQVLSLIHI